MPANGSGIYLTCIAPEKIVSGRGGRTYTEVAREAGVSVPFLNQLATGNACRVRAAHAAAIEDALGVPRGSVFALSPADAELLAPYRAPVAS
jgi:DNA-binding transcriptional regulator YdaS (Cro superfamily)